MGRPTIVPDMLGRRRRAGPLLVLTTVVAGLIGAGCGGGSSGKGGGAGTAATPSVNGGGSIAVTSSAFDGGQPVPVKFTCEGDNVPPPLRWSGVPAGTSEVALVLEDPDAPSGTFVHWIVLGLPASPAGEVASDTLASSAHQLQGSSGQAAYVGPCPPDNGGVHHYHFEVFALPAPPSVPSGAAPLDAVKAIRQQAKASGELIGTFHR